MALKTKQCKHGKFTYYDNDRYIGKQLDVLGYYSENEVQLLLKLGGVNFGVVIDVGANIGALTVPLAKVIDKVYAFEPQPAIYDLLCANIMQNNLTNVIAKKAAVGSKSGVAEVPRYDMDAPDMNTGAVAVVPIPKGIEIPDEAVVVPMEKLDNLVRTRWPVRLIKIDVEGMESDVLKGAKRIITNDRPVLYLENNTPGTPESKALIQQIMDMGYQLEWHLPVLECLTNATHRTLTLSSNMVCVTPRHVVSSAHGPDFHPITSPDDNWHNIPSYAQAIAACAG
jgi:FkbM family methyltransferase